MHGYVSGLHTENAARGGQTETFQVVGRGEVKVYMYGGQRCK